jgi:hypothetical protein
LLPLAILGLALGVLLRSLGVSRAHEVAIEPQVTEIAVDPMQYQAVTVHLQLANRTSKSIRVRKAVTSCGCASLVMRGGATLVEPLDVSSAARVPWQLVIHTQGRVGSHEFKALFEIESESGISQTEAAIRMNIRPAIALSPESLAFHEIAPGDKRVGRITLSDGYPDSGYKVADVRVSDPERLHVRIRPAAESEPTGLTDTAARDFRARWQIELHYLAPAAPRALVQDEIVLEPENSLHPSISIPVQCTMMPAEYEAFPEALVLTAECLGQTIQRTIRCRIRPDCDPAIQLVSAPAWTKLTIVDLDARTKELRITLEVPKSAADLSVTSPIVIGTGHSGPKPLSIPIEWLAVN